MKDIDYNQLGRDVVSTGLQTFFGKPASAPAPAPAPKPAQSDWKRFIPLGIGVTLAAVLVWALTSMRQSK